MPRPKDDQLEEVFFKLHEKRQVAFAAVFDDNPEFSRHASRMHDRVMGLLVTLFVPWVRYGRDALASVTRTG